MKIVTIIGARPQFIKAAAVSKAFTQCNNEKETQIEEVIIHTGQHFDENMSKIFFDEMGIPSPNYMLSINSLGHGAMTGRMLEEIETVLTKESPDWVLVYGDTNSTLAGALAASKLHIKVAHVEAGLRSFNKKMPEEINRVLTDNISDVLFCPTDSAMNNLKHEGIDGNITRVVKNGDVMLDAALFFSSFTKSISFDLPNTYVLCSVHRAENTDSKEKLWEIFSALNEISSKIDIVLPLHPRTKKLIPKYGIELSSNIKVIDPVGYLEMIALIRDCKFVMTDSGGLQKEAFFFKKFCITMREETEWVELIENGVNFLVGSDKDLILSKFNQISELKADFTLPLYGKGDASMIVANTLLGYN